MSHYKPYPAYRDSGVEWIGRVPEHWEVHKVGWDMRMSIGWTPPTGQARFYGGRHNWVAIADLSAKRITETKTKITDAAIEEKGAKPAPAGSLLFSYKLTVGEVALLEKPAYTNEAIAAFHPVPKVVMEWWRYAAPEILPHNGRENIYGALLLNQELMADSRFFAPDRTEQATIAAALDRETARIDALGSKKTRFIDLLKEKRQALITHAVTKGLDPTVKMKDSGVEWIGEVPAHWEAAQLGKLSVSRCDGPFGSGLKSEHYTETGVRVVRLQNIGWAEFKGGDAAYIAREYWQGELGGGHDVIPGDVLIAGLGDENNPLGRACVAPADIGDAMVKADCYRFRVGQRVVPEYVALSLSGTARAECGFLATGATRDRLNLTLASARRIPVPPIEEQREILRMIGVRVSLIDLLTNKTERSIALLKERRSALITAAVTGQIDLRGESSAPTGTPA
jgi:type I restriction enzyme S subunit